MSYILDALQRADAERDRGTIPTLQTRATRPASRRRAPSSSLPGRWTIAATLTLTLSLAGSGFWLWHADAPHVLAAQPPTGQTATAYVPDRMVVNLPVTPQPTVEPVATSAPTSVQPLPAKTAATTAGDSSAQARRPAAESADRTAAAAPWLSDLPQDMRSQIPELSISGAVASDNPAQRLLLVNGQVLAQGHLAAPELVLEEIRTSISEFSFRGTRFRVAH